MILKLQKLLFIWCVQAQFQNIFEEFQAMEGQPSMCNNDNDLIPGT